MKTGGGYFKDITSRVKYVVQRGIAKTTVKNPLQKEEGTAYTTPNPNDESRALQPKQDPHP